MKKALICGISGQDGAWLAKLLLEKGYSVYGTSRDAQMATFHYLKYLGIYEAVQLDSMALNDFRSVLQVLVKVQPDEIYNLAGQSSVGLSFQLPVETLESISTGTLNLLEAIRFNGQPVRFYNAGSSECFGDTGQEAANETTAFRPRSPYAVAKAAAFWEVANYREAYGLYASSGILFNHESPLRPERFVIRKIVSTAVKIAKGQNIKLKLGNINIWRDWGYAPEYVEAMWLMLQQDKPDDFIVATGKSYSLKAFIELVFQALNLDWREYTVVESDLFRPSDLKYSYANPEKSAKLLGWVAKTDFQTLIDILVKIECDSLNNRLIIN